MHFVIFFPIGGSSFWQTLSLIAKCGNRKSKDFSVMMASSSFSGSSKRAKALGNVIQVANCSVDGCNADLSLCRDYHRRHKVCELHSKSTRVMIRGCELRFCQQCSRFHSLMEFDEEKRSCRKRLDGHNRRRRKPQPDSVPRTSGTVFPSQPSVSSTQLLSFSSPLLGPNPVMSPPTSWTRLVKPESNMGLYDTQPLSNYSETQNSLHPIFNPNASLGNANTGRSIFSGGLNQVVDSDHALSLLSSTPRAAREFGLNESMHNLHYGTLGQYQFSQEMESKPVVSTMDSHGHLPEMFENGNEGLSSSGPRQTLSFMWE